MRSRADAAVFSSLSLNAARWAAGLAQPSAMSSLVTRLGFFAPLPDAGADRDRFGGGAVPVLGAAGAAAGVCSVDEDVVAAPGALTSVDEPADVVVPVAVEGCVVCAS